MKILKANRPRQGIMITGGTKQHQAKTSRIHAMIMADSGYNVNKQALEEVEHEEHRVDNTPDNTTSTDESTGSIEQISQESQLQAKENTSDTTSSDSTALLDTSDLCCDSIDLDTGNTDII